MFSMSGLPPSCVRSVAIRSRCSRIFRAAACISSHFSIPGTKRQSSCAFNAASTARSASSARARGTSSMISSVAGFSTAKVSPERLSTNSPSMNILSISVYLSTKRCLITAEQAKQFHAKTPRSKDAKRTAFRTLRLCLFAPLREIQRLRRELLLQRLFKSSQRDIDQLTRDHEWRFDANHFRFVQRVSDQHIAIEHTLRQRFTDFRIDNLDTDQQASPTHVANDFREAIVQLFQASHEVTAHFSTVFDEFFFLQSLDRRGRGRRGHRIRAES